MTILRDTITLLSDLSRSERKDGTEVEMTSALRPVCEVEEVRSQRRTQYDPIVTDGLLQQHFYFTLWKVFLGNESLTGPVSGMDGRNRR